jgi:hypothetical protein
MTSGFVSRGSRVLLGCVCLLTMWAGCDVAGFDLPDVEIQAPDLTPHTVLGVFKGTVTDTAEGSCYYESTNVTIPYNLPESYAMLIGIRDDGCPTGLWVSEGATGATRMPLIEAFAVDLTWEANIPMAPIGQKTYTITVNEASYSLAGFHFEYRMEGTDVGTSFGVETGGAVFQGPEMSDEYGVTITVDGELSGNTLKYSESVIRDEIYKTEGEYAGHCNRMVTSSGTLTKQ